VKKNYKKDLLFTSKNNVRGQLKERHIVSLLTFFLFFGFSVFSQTTNTYTTGTGSWVCPAGVTSVQVECWGAGGGGGFGRTTNYAAGGGGGGGEYTKSTLAVVPGTTYYYSVGSGGSGGTSAGTAATAGNPSCFSSAASCSGILASANGGGGGTGVATNTSGAKGNGGTGGIFSGIGSLSYTGGNGANGVNGNGAAFGGGGGGGGASTTGIGANASGKTGGIGATVGGGDGGNGAQNSAGSAGITIGGGGAGGHRNNTNNGGSAGATGQVRLTYTLPPPANDDCASAIALTVDGAATCTYTTYTNANATASSGVPAPGCANYSGGDVWFSFVVPASGEVTIDTQTGVILDGGMAWYTGACGVLTLLDCDDDNSANGSMPYITRTGLTPGTTIYVRVWEYGNDNNGTFGICASTRPACTTPTASPTALVLTQPTNGTINGSFTAAVPAPSNYLVVYNTTGTTPTPVNGTTYTVGDTTTGGTVADIDTNTTFSVTGLNANTTYYFFVFSYNGGSCAGGPLYKTTAPATGNTTTPVFYCASTSTSSTYYIKDFSTTLGSTNITNNASGYSATGYGDFTAKIVTQQQLSSVNFSTATYDGTYTYGINIWVDWNDDLDFLDAGEKVYASGAYVSSATGTITVPGTAPVGNHRMRIVANYNATDPLSCGSISSGETEDYIFKVTAAVACTTPTASPTVLVLTQPANGTINGSFTAAAPAPSNYLVVYNTTGTTPTPVNGTTYTVGDTTTGGTVADIDTNTTFSVTGLSANTTYYFFVFSYNGGGCTGGPLYKTTSPATGNATTPVFYCASTSTSSTYFINNFSTTGGTANITNNGSGYSASGYGNFSAQTVSQQNFGSVNFSIALNSTYTFGVNIWVDWNGDLDFNDAGELTYASGSYVNTATGSITVPGTAAVGSYRMRIVADYNNTNPSSCGSISSGETEDYTFTVPASTCPGIPTAVVVAPVASTTATVNWTASSPAPASGYQYYLTTSATLPTPATVPTGSTAAGVTTVNLTGLTANTTYYIYVRNNCGAGNVSPWTSQVSFYTGYCVSNSTTSTYFINNFSTTAGTANITNNGSGYSAGGYGNFTGQTVSQANGASVNFSIAMNSTYTFGVGIWIDWNDDLDFNDAGEQVYASGSYVNTATGTITVPAGASAGNHRMRIVANYSSTTPTSCGTISNGETEDYTFNVVALPCPTFVSNVLSNVTTLTTATISWTAASPAPASGYQYYLSTSSTNPSAGTAPTGSTAAGVTSVNLTGLTSGTTYYIWIRTDCGGASGQGAWLGPNNFYMPNCSIGTSLGTTTLGCPNVVSGGLGLNGADPASITCATGGCVDLEATYLQLGNTSSYTATSIPYNPPYQFGCLKNPVSVNVDDKWSSAINLPFNFCFYGNTYNQCVIGSNGVLTFDMTKAGTSSGYSFSNNLPSTTGALFANSIYGVYHDIDPAIGGEVGWELITLNTGCRALVASWNNVPMFSNNAILYTGMMVLYENTNIIEVYIKNKQIDGTWNSGNAIVGVQDATGTVATVAPGRNGLDADWTVTNEAWRFTPSGTSITSLTWYEGAGTSGPIVGTTPTINVCPSATTTYTAEVSYTLCNGVPLKVTDQTTVTVAANKTWNGATNTNWGTASNWTPGSVPTSAEAVVIPNTANKPIITGGVVAQACSLTFQNGA